MLDADMLARLRATRGAIAATDQALGRTFYVQLFRRVPSAEDLFGFDFHKRMHLMPGTLLVLADHLGRADGAGPAIARLAAAHCVYGVSGAELRASRSAFAAAVREVLGPILAEADRAAWIALYGAVAEAMAAEADRRGAAVVPQRTSRGLG